MMLGFGFGALAMALIWALPILGIVALGAVSNKSKA